MDSKTFNFTSLFVIQLLLRVVVNASASTLRCRADPYKRCGDNLLKLEILAVPFRSRAEPAERSNLREAGGLR